MTTKEPAWLVEARTYLGVREIPGLRHEPQILRWWRAIRMGGIRDDETPYCAAFVGAMLEDVGLLSSRSGAARSYLGWGVSLGAPAVGAIAVLSRPPSPTGGHTGFVVGVDEFGRVMILGANQDNEVNIKPFDRGRILAYKWPVAVPLPPAERLPLLASNGAPSSNREA
jgi:uncharacterized protein (TIGR02594 family)